MRRTLRRQRYRGDRVACPCCGGRFRRFMPDWNRADAICPRCFSHERHRGVWMYLHERRPELFSDQLSVLHFAPEEPFQRLLRSLPSLRYVSTDLHAPEAMHNFDIQEIPYEDDSFDVILCSHVLEHVPDDRRAMRELRRVLRPGGWALLLVPLDQARAETYEDPSIVSEADRRREFWQDDHVRLYGRDFPRRLEEAGFAVTVDRYMREVDPEVAARNGLRGDDIYVCTTRDG